MQMKILSQECVYLAPLVAQRDLGKIVFSSICIYYLYKKIYKLKTIILTFSRSSCLRLTIESLGKNEEQAAFSFSITLALFQKYKGSKEVISTSQESQEKTPSAKLVITTPKDVLGQKNLIHY